MNKEALYYALAGTVCLLIAIFGKRMTFYPGFGGRGFGKKPSPNLQGRITFLLGAIALFLLAVHSLR